MEGSHNFSYFDFVRKLHNLEIKNHTFHSFLTNILNGDNIWMKQTIKIYNTITSVMFISRSLLNNTTKRKCRVNFNISLNS